MHCFSIILKSQLMPHPPHETIGYRTIIVPHYNSVCVYHYRINSTRYLSKFGQPSER